MLRETKQIDHAYNFSDTVDALRYTEYTHTHTHTHQIGVEIVSFSISSAEFGLDVCFENLC